MANEPTNDNVDGEISNGVVRRRRKPEPEPEAAAAEDTAEATTSSLVEPMPQIRPEVAPPPEPPPTLTPDPAEPPAPEAAVTSGPRLAAPPKLDEEPESFEALLAASSAGVRQQNIEQGEMVEGRVAAFSGDWVFIDLASKTEGILAAEELRDEQGHFTKGIGDPVEAFVASTSGGEIRLSFALGRQIRDAEALFDAFEVGMPVEGKVIGTNKGGFEVRIAGRRAFCPISQIDVKFTEDPAKHVGQTYTFKLKQVSDDGKRIVVSRAEHLRQQIAEQRRETLEALDVGEELEGVVTSVQEYGAFVDIGGIEGLVHVSELSWTRVEHPSEVVKEGDAVTVKVKGIKQTDKGERISLSLRETRPHPWIQVGTKFVAGESYDGTVTRLEPYGAFVELGPGVEGLVHVSELSWARRINHPNEVLTEGQQIQVYIKSVDEERRRIALSMKALEQDPWSSVRDKYPVGAQVGGTIEKIQPFGIFVEVEPGLTALIPASESNTGQGSDLRREFEIGQKVTATVLNVEPGRRRMSLSLKAASEFKDQAAMRDFFSKQKKETDTGSGFGTLGDLFKDKLK